MDGSNRLQSFLPQAFLLNIVLNTQKDSVQANFFKHSCEMNKTAGVYRQSNLLIFSFWECRPSSKPPMGIMMILFPVTSWKVLAIGMVPPSRIRSGSMLKTKGRAKTEYFLLVKWTWTLSGNYSGMFEWLIVKIERLTCFLYIVSHFFYIPIILNN